MTHRVHPYIFRIGHTKPWKSRWLSRKKTREYLLEDTLLRAWLEKKLRSGHIEQIELERTPHVLNVIVKTARPGFLIGRGGEGAEKLKYEIQKFVQKLWKKFLIVPEKRDIKVTIEEVRSPETHAAVVAEILVEDIEKRISFRRAMKQAIEKVASAKGVQGVKIALKGRLDGAEMARYEWLKRGRIPLQTLRADIDYAEKTAYTAYGTIGVKVWIYKGEVFSEAKSNV